MRIRTTGWVVAVALGASAGACGRDVAQNGAHERAEPSRQKDAGAGGDAGGEGGASSEGGASGEGGAGSPSCEAATLSELCATQPCLKPSSSGRSLCHNIDPSSPILESTSFVTDCGGFALSQLTLEGTTTWYYDNGFRLTGAEVSAVSSPCATRTYGKVCKHGAFGTDLCGPLLDLPECRYYVESERLSVEGFFCDEPCAGGRTAHSAPNDCGGINLEGLDPEHDLYTVQSFDAEGHLVGMIDRGRKFFEYCGHSWQAGRVTGKPCAAIDEYYAACSARDVIPPAGGAGGSADGGNSACDACQAPIEDCPDAPSYFPPNGEEPGGYTLSLDCGQRYDDERLASFQSGCGSDSFHQKWQLLDQTYHFDDSHALVGAVISTQYEPFHHPQCATTVFGKTCERTSPDQDMCGSTCNIGPVGFCYATPEDVPRGDKDGSVGIAPNECGGVNAIVGGHNGGYLYTFDSDRHCVGYTSFNAGVHICDGVPQNGETQGTYCQTESGGSPAE